MGGKVRLERKHHSRRGPARGEDRCRHRSWQRVRPHCAHFGPDGLLYVSAELANAIYIVDTKTRSLVGEIPIAASHTHMLVISPDGGRIYTANNEAGSVSVLDLRARTLLTTIPISKKVQRISISPDGSLCLRRTRKHLLLSSLILQPTLSSDRFPSPELPSLPSSQMLKAQDDGALAVDGSKPRLEGFANFHGRKAAEATPCRSIKRLWMLSLFCANVRTALAQ